MDEARSIFKIVLLGDAGVGKTAIASRFFNASLPFDTTYSATIGIDFVTRPLTLRDGRQVRLRVWDTAGQERFRSLIPSYLRDADVAMLVYDVSTPASRHGLQRWLEAVLQYRSYGKALVLFVVANKTDLERRCGRDDSAETLEREVRAACTAQQAPPPALVDYAETSARGDPGSVQALFERVSEALAKLHNVAAARRDLVVTSENIDLSALRDEVGAAGRGGSGYSFVSGTQRALCPSPCAC